MTGIPTVGSYGMPAHGDLPVNTVDWTLEPHRAVLLIHDMQQYFLRPFGRQSPLFDELLANITHLRDVCAAAGVVIAYTAQPGGMTREQRGLLRDFWGDGMSVDETDREIIPELTPRDEDWVFTKWRYSAFHKSDLAARLRDCGRDQMIVCGVYAHVGILMTACDAFSHDVETFLVSDAIADFTRADHVMTLEYAASRCAMVQSTDRIASALSNTAIVAGSKEA